MQENVSAQPLPGTEGVESTPSAPSITSLDSLSEFEFQGEKYTPERLQEVFKGYQALSEEQKSYKAEQPYWENLKADLMSVKQDPSLVAKFKQTYPKKFHSYVDELLGVSDPRTQGIPKEFLNEFGQLKNEFNSTKEQLQQMLVESANAKLDALLPKLYEKFPLADEDAVLARAEGFLSQGGKLTDQVWERLAKESHEKMSKKSDAFYKKQLEAQLKVGTQGMDSGPGGAVPGKAPVKLRSFEDADRAIMAHLKSQGIT